MRRTGLLSFAAVLAMAGPAAAQSRSWQVCGGNAFNTCAAVNLTVVGQSVTLQVWNLSGMSPSDYAGTVFTAIGFENIGTAAAVAGSLAMSGPVRPGDAPSPWQIQSNTQVGGGVTLDLVGLTGTGVDNGIASACAAPGQLPGGSNDFWMNPCGPAGNTGWITLNFSITGTWNLDDTFLLVKGQNGPNGQSTECITDGPNANCYVTPEPITIVLLGSGLAGVGGVGFMRRRRGDSPEA